MESLLIILFAVVVILLIAALRSDLQKKFDILNRNFIAVHKQVKALTDGQQKETVAKTSKGSSLEEVPLRDNALEVSYQLPVAIVPKKEKESVPGEKNEPIEKEQVQKPALEPVIPAMKKETQPVATTASKQTVLQDSAVKTKKASGDFEKLIGENWLNKIGIAILVVGIGFFVKYAIDRNWIGETGRLFIGVGTAFVLIGIAHWLRKSYHAFSSVLVGGGIATLYYTISIGYHDYALFSQPVAFTIMCSITLLATLFSLWYDRQELAIIALVGGFTAPFLVAGETKNPDLFFTYIAILNTGMLLLSFFKKWPVPGRLAFLFTTLFMTIWMFAMGIEKPGHRQTAYLFLSVFFVQFLAANMAYNLLKKIRFSAWEFIQLFSVSGIYYGSMMYVMEVNHQGVYEGMFTLLLAILYLVLTTIVKRLPQADPLLDDLLSGKTIAFITLTIFMQFEGHYTTLFWALEAVVLLWLAVRSGTALLRHASALVLLVATIAMMIDWSNWYYLSSTRLSPFFNPAIATGFFVLACYTAYYFLLVKAKAENAIVGFSTTYFKSFLGAWIFVALYLVLLLELVHQADRFNSLKIEVQLIWLYHLAYLMCGAVLARFRENVMPKNIFFVLGTLAVFLFIFTGHPANVALRDMAISNPGWAGFYYAHFTSVALLTGLIVGLRYLSFSVFEEKRHADLYLVLLSLFGLYVITAELDMLAVYHLAGDLSEKANILEHTQIAGYTILWGIYSFLLMIFGMRKKLRAVRIFSLVAFSVTLIKLFAFDIRHISEGGKIAAFISLGVMLLVISFLYQKLRKLIVDGEVG